MAEDALYDLLIPLQRIRITVYSLFLQDDIIYARAEMYNYLACIELYSRAVLGKT